ncbi:hypothetical protein J3459_018337 [Metarhizium acridum]|nr:hypothetical protein J3459_018337 [Metarhizium acridum]
MAPSAPQQLHAHRILYPAKGRLPLTPRTTNNSRGSYPNGVCKPKPRNRTNPPTIQGPSPITKPVDLGQEQIESATAIFRKLQEIPDVSKRTPTLRKLRDEVDCGQYELVYPKYRLWRLSSDHFQTKWTQKRLNHLRDNLIRTVSTLYDAHVAFILDLATFSVVKKLSQRRGGAVFVPFLDTFDFDKHPNDRTMSWEQLKQKQVSIVNAHFDVLELIAELSEPSTFSQPPQIRVDLQPDVVVEVVEQSCLHDDQRNWVIGSVSKYSPKLGRLVVQHASGRARTLLPRADLAEVSTNKSIHSHCSTISHVLDLLDRYIRDGQAEACDMVDRAALLVVQAVLTIHLHARAIQVVHSRGILDMNCCGTVEAYTSYESFQAVAKVCSLAKAAIQVAPSDQLDAEIACFLRGNSPDG